MATFFGFQPRSGDRQWINLDLVTRVNYLAHKKTIEIHFAGGPPGLELGGDSAEYFRKAMLTREVGQSTGG